MKKLITAIPLAGLLAIAAFFLFSNYSECSLCIVKGEPAPPCGRVKGYIYLLGKAGFRQTKTMGCGRQMNSDNQVATIASTLAMDF